MTKHPVLTCSLQSSTLLIDINTQVKASLRMAGVNVLGMPSRKESVVLAVKDLRSAGGGASITASMVAASLLGARCYVSWPYLQVMTHASFGVGVHSSNHHLRVRPVMRLSKPCNSGVVRHTLMWACYAPLMRNCSKSLRDRPNSSI